MDLASIIEQLGISEEELMEAIAAEEGGGGEAPPEMGGGEAPPEAGGESPAEPPMEVEARDKEALDYIKEIVSRSRAKKAAARA